MIKDSSVVSVSSVSSDADVRHPCLRENPSRPHVSVSALYWRPRSVTRRGFPSGRCLSSSCRSGAPCGSRCCSSGAPQSVTTPRTTPSGRSRRWRRCRRTASAAGSSASAGRSAPAQDTRETLKQDGVVLASRCDTTGNRVDLTGTRWDNQGARKGDSPPR